jgi:dipeptidyl-peptidase-4
MGMITIQNLKFNIQNKSFSLLAVSFLLICLNALGQNRMLTIEEAMLGMKTTLAPEKLKQLKWVKGASAYSYVMKHGGKEILMKAEVLGKAPTEVVSKEVLNKLLREQNTSKEKQDSLSDFPAIEWQSNSEFTFECGKVRWTYDMEKKAIQFSAAWIFNREAENKEKAPKTQIVSYTVKNNLFVSDGKVEQAVTHETNSNIVNGQSVHREEFGISKGMFWSPMGNKLAFYRMDQTMVADYPVIDWTTQPAQVKNIKYPMAGGISHEVKVGIYDPKSGSRVFMKTGLPADQYLTNIAWSPDEQHVFIAVLNREQDTMNLNSYSSKTGEFEKTIFTETDKKYTEPLHPMLFVTGQPDLFIWQSRRDGWNHLYLYSLSQGKLIRQLTKGEWEVTDVNGFDPKGEKLFYMSNAESPLVSDMYCVKTADGRISRLTQGSGVHNVMLNENATLFIDQFSNANTPLETSVYSADGKKLQVLLNAGNPLKDYQLGQVSLFKIKGDSGQDLYCRMYMPVNFDSTKKYPLIVYQYGGPHVQLVLNSWNAGARDYWFQYMAEHGFVVFTLDPRGSENRGKAFEQSTFRQLGTCEMQDQLAGVRYLKKRSYVDSTRLGLFGWSFGGFMTCSIMTRHPGVFKAAVAGGPVIDWSYYEVMFTERYMDTPVTNPKGYADNNVLNYVGDLQGKLLLIHGTSDPVVVWQHSIMFLRAAVDKKKQVDYFVYPGHEHNVTGKDRVHLYTKVSDYFLQNL